MEKIYWRLLRIMTLTTYVKVKVIGGRRRGLILYNYQNNNYYQYHSINIEIKKYLLDPLGTHLIPIHHNENMVE